MTLETTRATNERPAVRVWRQTWIFRVALILAFLSFAIESFVVSRVDSVLELENTSPDEAVFLNGVEPYREFLLSLDPSKNQIGMSGGYGLTFWLLLALLDIITPGSWSFQFAVTRLIFLSAKYAAFVLSAYTVRSVRGDKVASLFLMVVMISPGYWFYGKIISPEYLLLLLTATSIWFLIRDRNKFGRNFSIAVIFGVLTAYTKISMLPLVALVVGYGLLHKLQAMWNRQEQQANGLLWGVAGGVLITGIVVYLSGGVAPILADMRGALLIAAPLEFTMERVRHSYEKNMLTWDQIEMVGIRHGFLPIVSLSFYCLIGNLAVLARWRDKIIPSPASYASWLIFLVAILLAINPIFREQVSWYLFTPLFLILLSSCLLIPEFRYSQVIVIVFGVVIALDSVPKIYQSVQFKLNKDRQARHVLHNSGKIDALIMERCPSATLVHVDILIPLLLPLR